MKKNLYYFPALFTLILLFVINSPIQAQKDKNEQRKRFYTALNHMYDEKYNDALSLLLALDTTKLEPFLKEKDVKINTDTISLEKIYIKYLIGACYLQMKYDMDNTIPYIEYVLNSGYSETPEIVFKDLGRIYHKDYQFNKAIYYFNKYLKKTQPTDEHYGYAKRMIEICNNAIEITKDTLPHDIFHLGNLVNTEDSESNPLVSAANDVMVFTFQQFMDDPRANRGTPLVIQQTKISQKEFGVWGKARTIVFETPENLTGHLSVIGLSYGGAQLFVKVHKDKRIEYYSTLIEKYRCRTYTKLGFISGKYDITNLYMSPDGNLVFFSGRHIDENTGNDDIFMITQNENGRWKNPERLDNKINTTFDEINPVLAQQGEVLYFSSNGHNTIGGFDIFKSTKQNDGTWSTPQNMGFPINTTEDNNDFYVSNRGNTGYFSATQFDKYNNRDIYSINIRENIPVTLINGKLLAGDSLQPINAKIHVINSEDNTKYLLNTNPHPDDGSYYIFCPPDKDYDMIIEAEGYMPQMVSIHVPSQSYFYTLFQEIQLKPIRAVDAILGEEIIIKNAFYDVKRANEGISPKVYENSKYEEMVNLVKKVQEQEQADSVNKQNVKDYNALFNFVENAIEAEDSVSLNLLRDEVATQDLYSQTYFFSEDSTNSSTFAVKIKDRIVYTATPVEAKSEIKKTSPTYSLQELIKNNQILSIIPDSISAQYNETEMAADSTITQIKDTIKTSSTRKIFTFEVYFNSNSYVVDSLYYPKFDELIALLINNRDLSIEISGYTNSIGSHEANLALSRERSLNVMEYFVTKGIKKERLIIKYFGKTLTAKEQSDEDIKRNRRVELKIIEFDRK